MRLYTEAAPEAIFSTDDSTHRMYACVAASVAAASGVADRQMEFRSDPKAQDTIRLPVPAIPDRRRYRRQA